MALTRAQFETILIDRVGGWLTEAGKDGTSHEGANPDLNDPIGYAVRRLGGTVADPTNVADADLSGLASTDYDAGFDIAEWRALENLARGLRKVDTRVGPLSQSFSQLRRDVLQAASEKRMQIENDYGLLGATLQAGVLTLDIALKDDDTRLTEES